MFSSRSRSPGIATAIAVIVSVLALLAIGLWFGGHRSWLPSPLRSTFTAESSNDKLVNEVTGLLSKDYYRKVNTSALVNTGLSAAVASLHDPYSHYYDPSQYGSFQQITDPHLSGIGVDIDHTPKGLLILQVFPLTPAAKAGLKPGEVITAVGSKRLAHLTADQSSALIKGAAGTDVTITVRDGKRSFTKTLTRANVVVPVAASRILDYHGIKVGYVQLSQFAVGAGAEVRTQVAKVRRHGARALILDLRDNGGGLLQEAIATASIFIPSGTIVSTDGRAQPREVYMATGDAIPTSIPLVVLVNRDTASSSEIVTGALKDRGRATVVGTRTYGKGVFQEIEQLRNGGALDFTVGEYFTPNGQNLGAGGVKRGPGIKPNVYAFTKPGAHTDTALRVAEKTVAAKLAAR